MTKNHLRLADDPTEDRDDSMSNAALISHDIAVESFTDAFRRRVGMGAGKISVSDFADAIDAQPRTVKSWRDGDTMPYWMHMLRVCAYFGPAFTSEILVPAGMGGVDLIDDVERDPQGTATDLIAVAHDLLDRLRDGRFCHVDRAETAPVLLELSRQIEAQARALGKK